MHHPCIAGPEPLMCLCRVSGPLPFHGTAGLYQLCPWGLCTVRLCKDGLASCEGIVGAERGAGGAPSTCHGECSIKLIVESRLRHLSCLHFTKGGN